MGPKSLSDNLHGEGSGDFRVQSDGRSELAGGLDRIHGDVLRVDGSLEDRAMAILSAETPPNSLPDSETLAAISTTEPSIRPLAATASSRVATALARRARFMASIWAAAFLDQAKPRLRDQVVASVTGLDGHDVARVTQVIDGLGKNNLSFSHCSNLSQISDRKWRTAAKPSRGRS